MGTGPVGLRNALEEMAGGWYASDDQPKANEDADTILGYVGHLGPDAADAENTAVSRAARRAAAALATDLDEQDEITEEITDVVRAYWRAEQRARERAARPVEAR